MRFIYFFLTIGFFGISFAFALPPPRPIPASKLKTTLLALHQEHRFTFWCAQKFNEAGSLSLKSCQRCPKTTSKIQWMPVVPLQQLSKHFRCYHEKICLNKKGLAFKGLRCCLELDPHFKMAAVDLHNFVPELKIISQQRHQFTFAHLSDKDPEYNRCELIIDKQKKIIQTPIVKRGMVARSYLYMRETYFFPLSEDELALYHTWHRQYPPQAWEIARNEKIYQIQGNRNPYIR